MIIKRIATSLLILTSLTLGLVVFGSTGQVNAQSDQSTLQRMCVESGGTWNGSACTYGCATSFLGLPAWYKYLQLDSECNVVGPTENVATGRTDDTSTPQDESIKQVFSWERAAGYIAIAIVEMLLRIASLVAVGFVIYGGFRYIASQGEPENAKSARQTIINALIGLVIAIAAASIVAFIGNRLGTPS